jgi:hypothetical protein
MSTCSSNEPISATFEPSERGGSEIRVSALYELLEIDCHRSLASGAGPVGP